MLVSLKMHLRVDSVVNLLALLLATIILLSRPSAQQIQPWPHWGQLRNSGAPRQITRYCEQIQAYHNFSLEQLRGGWVALESMAVSSEGEGDQKASWRSRLCIHSEVVNATSQEITMLSELHLPDDDSEDSIEIARNQFELRTPLEPGRWHVVSSMARLKGSEMVIVACDPTRFLVMALCVPEGSNSPNFRVPDPLPSVLSGVTVLARRDERGSTPLLDSYNLGLLRSNINEALDLKYTPSSYDTSC